VDKRKREALRQVDICNKDPICKNCSEEEIFRFYDPCKCPICGDKAKISERGALID
jgi:hypothetical protein